MSEKRYIAIAGNMGVGKSTLTGLLSERFGWKAVFENADKNPYLPDFFSDMKRWSFNHQTFFLIERFRQHKHILTESDSCIQDRTIYEDAEIFARNLFDMGILSERDYETYRTLYQQFVSLLTPPDLVIYLRASIPKIVAHVQKRGRDYESKVQLDYLQRLNDYYDQWYNNYNHGRKLVIETESLDFVENPSDYNLVVQRIENELFGLFSNEHSN
ncbi:MAG: deoxynucleoside kinase [Chloroherpetonaceae bacterium]|nr:deoxynucleoside kinase [Chloroherpetonaceae bacterium]